MPRFVLLYHEMPENASRPSHWDLMLQIDETLQTWALPSIPQLPCTLEVEKLPDHRLDYLEYEGPISNNRGSVSRVDQGDFIILNNQNSQQLIVQLRGETLMGQITLQQSEGKGSQWRLEFRAVGQAVIG